MKTTREDRRFSPVLELTGRYMASTAIFVLAGVLAALWRPGWWGFATLVVITCIAAEGMWRLTGKRELSR